MRSYKKLVSELLMAGFLLAFYHHVIRKVPHALHKTEVVTRHLVI